MRALNSLAYKYNQKPTGCCCCCYYLFVGVIVAQCRLVQPSTGHAQATTTATATTTSERASKLKSKLHPNNKKKRREEVKKNNENNYNTSTTSRHDRLQHLQLTYAFVSPVFTTSTIQAQVQVSQLMLWPKNTHREWILLLLVVILVRLVSRACA